MNQPIKTKEITTLTFLEKKRFFLKKNLETKDISYNKKF